MSTRGTHDKRRRRARQVDGGARRGRRARGRPGAGRAGRGHRPLPGDRHRLAVALEAHGLLRRDGDGRFALGLGCSASAAPRPPMAASWTRPVRCSRGCGTTTGESVQLYVRDGDGPRVRRFARVAERAAHDRAMSEPAAARRRARPVACSCDGAGARRWVESVEERAPGVASVSARAGPGGAVAGRHQHVRPDRAHDPPARAQVRRRGRRSRRSDRAGP